MTASRFALTLRGARVCMGRSVLLDGIELSVPEQGLFGVVGPNGAGKSTLAKAAIGLMPLACGEVRLLDRPLGAWSPRERAARIGYLPQNLHSHWDLTVAELLQLAMAPVPETLLAECELAPLLERRYASLSGGEQARAAIARAIAHAPALLLADEPAAHLDVPHQHQLMQLLHARSRTSAVVVVIHDLHLASRYCDEVAIIARGGLLACGPPHEVLQPWILADAYGAHIRRFDIEAGAFFTAGRN